MNEQTQNCDICSKPVDVQSPHVFSINDVMLQGPMHVECWQQASAEGGVVLDGAHHELEDQAHFEWPPHDGDMHLAYREFLDALQERVDTLPYSEDQLAELSDVELNQRHARVFFERVHRNFMEEHSELEEQLANEIARRDERTVRLTPEQYDIVQAGGSIRLDDAA